MFLTPEAQAAWEASVKSYLGVSPAKRDAEGRPFEKSPASYYTQAYPVRGLDAAAAAPVETLKASDT